MSAGPESAQPRRTVELSEVHRSFGFFRALDGVDLHATPGETILLLGPNGAGKTTLLRVVAGLLPVTQGALSVLGGDPRGSDCAIRGRIGFLSHNLGLYPDLTAAENLRFFERLYRLKRESGRIYSLLKEVGLESWADQPVRVFSRGMKQRLALARVFLHDPDLLLLDEPFTGLDLRSAGALAERLQRRRDQGASVLLATHRVEVAGPLGDRAVLLRQGRVAHERALDGLGGAEKVAQLQVLLEGNE
jgi:heme ABC exporter ATP-binding subunit CcmA